MSNEALVVLCGRNDGIGDRIKALLNSMIISEAAGGRFLFHWPALDRVFDAQFLQMPPVERMFSSSFIAAHHITAARLRSLAPTTLSRDLREFAGLSLQDLRGVYIAQGGERLRPGSHIGPLTISADCYQRAFKRLEFSAEIESAFDAARGAEIPEGAVALHIRSGDLVYGEYRYFGTLESKVIPLEIAEFLLRSKLETKFVVFCQDRDILNRVKMLPNVIIPDDLLGGRTLDPVQSILFEISLMSRCKRIIAGSSAFAALAALISGNELEAITTHLTAQTCIDVAMSSSELTTDLPGVSRQQRAMTAWWVIVTFADTLVSPQELQLVRHARAMDPVNPQYWLHEAALHIGADDVAELERVLYLAVLDNDEARAAFVNNIEMMGRRSALKRSRKHLESLAIAAARGGRLAMAIYAIVARQLGRPDDADRYAKRFKALSLLADDIYSTFTKYV